MWKNKKGVSLTVMVITILVIFIVLSTLTYSVSTSTKTRKLNKLYEDIRQLNDAVAVYYLKNGALPVDDSEPPYKVLVGTSASNDIKCVLKKDVERITGKESFFNPNDFRKYLTDTNDGAEYRTIRTNLLENITLNYTGDYLINLQSHTIYYQNGIKVDNQWYYTLPLEYTDVGTSESNIVDSIALISGETSLYFPLRGSQFYLSDKVKFYDEMGLEVINPKSVTYQINVNNYIEVDENTGLIRSIDNDSYENLPTIPLTVTVRNYGDDRPLSANFNIILTNIGIEDENQNPVDTIDLLAWGERDFVFLDLKGSSKGEINIEIEDEDIINATYYGRRQQVKIEPLGILGTTHVTVSEENGNASITLTVNVTDYGDNIATYSDSVIPNADFTMIGLAMGNRGSISTTMNFNNTNTSDFPILLYYYIYDEDANNGDGGYVRCAKLQLDEGTTTKQYQYTRLTSGQTYEILIVAMSSEGKRGMYNNRITLL